ncbi:hypothetical protein QJQ45_009991 [Haematococcus lacustris]|nr:hypothetical protein QJQ45_009991 [Haematococcus lacustris]
MSLHTLRTTLNSVDVHDFTLQLPKLRTAVRLEDVAAASARAPARAARKATTAACCVGGVVMNVGDHASQQRVAAAAATGCSRVVPAGVQPPPQQPPQQQGRSSWGTALEGQMLAPPIASPQEPIASPDLRHMYQLALAAIATQGQAAPAQGSELGAAAPAPGFTLRKRTTPSELGLPKTAAKRKRAKQPSMEGLLVEAIALAAACLLATGIQPTTLTLEQMRLLQQRCLQVVVQQKQQMQAQQMQQMQQSTLLGQRRRRSHSRHRSLWRVGRRRDDEDNEEEDGATAGTAVGAADLALLLALLLASKPKTWETECSRVRSTAAAADRDAVLKHTSIAMEKSNGDMQHYRSWMEELTRTWEQHEPQLDLPPKPEPLPQLPQRLGPNSSQRDQLGREEAPAEEDSDNDTQGVNVHRGLDYGLS